MADAEGEPVVKTAKQLEKEAKKLAKLEKFKGKQDKKKDVQPAKEKIEVCSFYLSEACSLKSFNVSSEKGEGKEGSH